MPIRPKKKPAWKLEQERAITQQAIGRTRAGARANQIADHDDKVKAEADRRARDATIPPDKKDLK